MAKALNRFTKEDPTFQTYVDPESNETIIKGMGELHLAVYVERMKREYKCEVIVGQPQVAYRESITQSAPFNYTHKKQTGGSGQYGRVAGIMEPLADKDYEFVDAIKAFLYGDLLQKLRNATLPYEKERGAAERLYEKWHEKCLAELMDGSYFKYADTVRRMVQEFDALPLVEGIWKPKVGIVGEILVKYHPVANNHIEVGDLVIDTTAYTARLRGAILDLTYKEFELLKYLAANRGRVLTRETLLHEVWGEDYIGGSRTVDVHIRRLRAKLGTEHDHIIGTVRNVGYRLDAPGDE